MMHHELYALTMCVFVEFFDVKVGIWGDKVEDIILPMTKPIFPTNVPSFDKHLLKTILCSKVDVAFHIGCVGRVNAIGLHFGVIGHTKVHRRHIKGVGPGLASRNHFPPNTTIFRGMYPACVLNFAGFVEV